MKSPIVSVIVPIYNVSKYIERCVRSLMEQTCSDIEYIFVNDATPDDSITILERVLEDYPQRRVNVKILHNIQNQGLAKSRFIGMDKATGEYVLHCDSDDWVERNMVQTMLEAALAHEADMVCCEAVKETPSGKSYYKYAYDEETRENGLLALNLTEIHVAVWNKLIRRALLLEHSIRNYEGINMGEDSALTVRLRYFSRKTIIVHQPLYHYNRLNQDSMVARINENGIQQRICLAKHIEEFFASIGKEEQYRRVINCYKFDSKQLYLRVAHDLRKWRSIYPESHADIFHFKGLTLQGKIKWWICAYFPLWMLSTFIKKSC